MSRYAAALLLLLCATTAPSVTTAASGKPAAPASRGRYSDDEIATERGRPKAFIRGRRRFQRFPGVAGSLYFVGGVGCMHFSRKKRINPF
jgi:hypothetical protein